MIRLTLYWVYDKLFVLIGMQYLGGEGLVSKLLRLYRLFHPGVYVCPLFLGRGDRIGRLDFLKRRLVLVPLLAWFD
jgi:hypothetical protein